MVAHYLTAHSSFNMKWAFAESVLKITETVLTNNVALRHKQYNILLGIRYARL